MYKMTPTQTKQKNIEKKLKEIIEKAFNKAWYDHKTFCEWNDKNNVRFFQSPDHVEAFVKGRITRNEKS